MPKKHPDYPHHSKLFPQLLSPALQFLSVAEVAIILGTSKKLVLEWVNQGLLRSFRMGPKGRLIRVRVLDLETFIDANIKSGKLSLKEPEQPEEPLSPEPPEPGDNP